MSQHITKKQCEGFVLKTLTDAEREHITRHTTDCPNCWATLQEYEVEFRRIRYELQMELRQARPSPQMNFAAIASDIPRLRRFTMWQQTSTRVLTGALALAMLIIGFIALNNFWQQPIELAPIVPDVSDVDVATDSSQTLTQLGDGRSVPGWHTNNTRVNWQEATIASSDYEVGIDTAVSYQGGHSGYIQSRVNEDDTFSYGDLAQTIRADAYRGQRVRFAAFLTAASDTAGMAGLYARVYDASGYLLNRDDTEDNALDPAQDWQQREIVLDVPENSAFITFGASLDGNGRVWVDNWTIEIVSNNVPVTGDYSAPHNLGLEVADENGFPQHWFLAGSAPEAYQASLDDSDFTEGQTSALLQSDTASVNKFGTLMQSISPGAFRGQRVRLTADVKSEDAAAHVMPWMRVDGPNGQILQFDNNDDQFLSGTNDWTPYEIVLDVPEECTGIFFGLMVGGKGKGWIDNVKLEIVGEDVPSTNSQAGTFAYEAPLRTELQPEGSARISTPLSGWFEAGTQPEVYETGVDTAVLQPNSSLRSVLIRGNDAGAAGSGALAQAISAQDYRGQRISLMLYLRGDGITGQAAPWLRVDSRLSTLAKAEVGSLALSGSQEWTPYELVLDVPDEAWAITFGVSLEGAGTVWIGDVQLETVSDDVPTTNMFDAVAPINLDFEE